MDEETSTVYLQPWGQALGLIASCLVILISILRSVSPSVIVLRAVAAGLLTAVVVRGFVTVLKLMESQSSKEA